MTTTMFSPLPQQKLDTILAGLAKEDQFVFLETSKTSSDNCHSYLFTQPLKRLTYRAGDPPDLFFAEAQKHLDKGHFLAGYLSYEFGYSLEPVLEKLINTLSHDQNNNSNRPILADWGVFQTPIVYDHKKDCFSKDLPFSASQEQVPELGSYHLADLTPSQKKEDYLSQISKVKEYIAAGDTYQVNYTLKLLFDFEGSPEALYKTLRLNQPVAYSAYLKLGKERILSFSPELFFKKTNTSCTVRPMKGTMQRGRTLEEDLSQANFLHKDIKNRSENVMIVDLLRNDLGRLSKMGSVAMNSMFDIETYATLHQMTSTVTGQLNEHITLLEMFKALYPCGSVTGAPKIRTMEIIHELERHKRGVYTGGIGFIAPDGRAQFNVPIRTIVLNHNQGEMGIGSGIIHDSDPESEWQECLLKGKFVTDPKPDFQLIETLLWSPDKDYWLIDLHVERLLRSAKYFAYPVQAENVKSTLNEYIENFTGQSARRIRLLLYRDGHLELSSAKCDLPKEQDLPIETPPKNLPSVIISTTKTDSRSPLLFHKTTLRDMYNQEREQALKQGHHEVIFFNERDELTEGSVSNIFIKQGDLYLTPPQECGLLAGTHRQYLLKTYPNLIQESPITASILSKAEAIYITNSVRGLTQVRVKGL